MFYYKYSVSENLPMDVDTFYGVKAIKNKYNLPCYGYLHRALKRLPFETVHLVLNLIQFIFHQNGASLINKY